MLQKPTQPGDIVYTCDKDPFDNKWYATLRINSLSSLAEDQSDWEISQNMWHIVFASDFSRLYTRGVHFICKTGYSGFSPLAAEKRLLG